MADDIFGPIDESTASESDTTWNDAALLAQIAYAPSTVGFVVQGLGFSVDLDASPPLLTVETGWARLADTQGQTRDHTGADPPGPPPMTVLNQVLPTQMAQRSGLELTPDSQNWVYLTGNRSVANSGSYAIEASEDPPTGPSLLVGTVDTTQPITNEAIDERNRESPLAAHITDGDNPHNLTAEQIGVLDAIARAAINPGAVSIGDGSADTITETNTPASFSFTAGVDRDIHTQTDVTLSNGAAENSTTEDVTVEYYDGAGTTGALVASDTQSVTVSVGATSTVTFLANDHKLDTGDYHIEITTSGTTLAVDQTDEYTLGAEYDTTQTATGDLETTDHYGTVVARRDSITGSQYFPALDVGELIMGADTVSDITGTNLAVGADGVLNATDTDTGTRDLQPEGSQAGLAADGTGIAYEGVTRQLLKDTIVNGDHSVYLEAATASSAGDETVTVELYDDSAAAVVGTVDISGGSPRTRSSDLSGGLTAGNETHVRWVVSTASGSAGATFDALTARIIID